MKASSTIVFFGNERLSSGFSPVGAPTLSALVANGYNVAAVVVNHEASTSRKSRPLEIAEVAAQHNIPVLSPDKPAEIIDQLKGYNAPVGVLVAYGRMVPQSIIDIFPRGIINIHPSLLPLNRGSSPIEQAMLDGATQTGVSLMGLVKAMDAGPVYAQATVVLNGTETKAQLTNTLLKKGGEMLIETLPSILDGTAQTTQQDDSKATFSQMLTKADGVLDLAKPADRLEREVRAYATWPKSRLEVFGQQIIVTGSRVAQSQTDGQLVVACGNNSYLEVTQLIGPSGRTMSGADFIRGYKK
jgi:methionyl-tRNA formyltransferase